MTKSKKNIDFVKTFSKSLFKKKIGKSKNNKNNKSKKRTTSEKKKKADTWCRSQRFNGDSVLKCSISGNLCYCDDGDGGFVNINKEFIKKFGINSIRGDGKRILYKNMEY